VSNLSFGFSVVIIVVLTGSPDPRLPPFGVGHEPVSGQLCGTAGGGASHVVPGSCRLSATGIRVLGHPSPAGGLGLPCGRLTGPQPRSPDPNGVVTLHTHEMRPGRVPSIPRGRWCSCGWHRIPSRHLPLRSGQSLHPGTATTPGSSVTRHHRGFTDIHPSGLPLACDPRVGRESSGVSPELHTPPLPATHVEVRTGTRALAWSTSPTSVDPPISRIHSLRAPSCRTSVSQDRRVADVCTARAAAIRGASTARRQRLNRRDRSSSRPCRRRWALSEAALACQIAQGW
jgi:hypothetical protein